ncbi:MAG: Hydrolase, TatD family [Candidatus Levybacteria bacterium GW2011_GWA2_40_8]|nr:MAG: Hydrolase, TatD family [Candidatus Levybacteria bacterium GW2011_GWA2_40_8]
MIDVHCHLNFHAFEKDYDEVIKRAHESGIEKIINVGTRLDSSKKALELAEKYDKLFAILGIHPHHADKLEDGWEKELKNFAQNKKVVAIGEIGLDYYRYETNQVVDPKLQKKVFETQIELAHQLNLPLQIHNRHAGEDIVEVLKHHKNLLKNPPGMFHCFAGTMDVLKDVLDMGFYIGFDGNLTYEGLPPGETVSLRELAKHTPTERLLTETDSPYLAPVPHRGSRNEPSYAIILGKFLAEIKGTSFEKLKEQTTRNAQLLFNI